MLIKWMVNQYHLSSRTFVLLKEILIPCFLLFNTLHTIKTKMRVALLAFCLETQQTPLFLASPPTSRYRTAWVAWAGVSSSAIRISGWWSARSTHTYRSHWYHPGQSSSGESARSMGSAVTPEWQIPGSALAPRRSLRLISNSINSNLCNSNNSKLLVRFSRLQWRINLSP